MFKPIVCFIAWRYLRSKRRGGFISFVAIASVVGIALGVAVLITVLSVMNGFENEIQRHIFNTVQQVTIRSAYGLEHSNILQHKFLHVSHVQAAASFVESPVLLSHDDLMTSGVMRGISPQHNQHVSAVLDHLSNKTLKRWQNQDFGLIIGSGLARRLLLKVGDTVTLTVPKPNLTLFGMTPRFKTFRVSGIFNLGDASGMDHVLVLVHLHDAQKLLKLEERVSGIQLKLDHIGFAPQVSHQLRGLLPPGAWVTDWTQQYGRYFRSIRLEKNMMFLVLMMIIAVAAFNLVSGLVMVVVDKRSEIAILRTMGATPRRIQTIFIIQGLFLGGLGILLGTLLGVELSLHVTAMAHAVQSLFRVQFVDPSVYFIDHLPSQLKIMQIIKIAGLALLFSLLATLYPAYRAGRVRPVEVLRYEQ